MSSSLRKARHLLLSLAAVMALIPLSVLFFNTQMTTMASTIKLDLPKQHRQAQTSSIRKWLHDAITIAPNISTINITCQLYNNMTEKHVQGVSSMMLDHANSRPSPAQLAKLNTRFYIYDLPELNLKQYQRQESSFQDPEEYEFLGSDAQVELLIIEALQTHRLRTYDPKKAEIFVIPLSPATVKISFIDRREYEERFYKRAFSALNRQNNFRATRGARHVIVSIWYGQFEHRFRRIPGYQDDSLLRFYDQLWNITVADCKSRQGIERLYREGKHSDFMKFFEYERIRVTRSSFSVGMIPNKHIPLIAPTLGKFYNSSYFIFYHTRPSNFWSPRSDAFRRAALNETVVQGLPSSSIGYDISSSEWGRRLISSKFCLVIRGDDPGSHALYRSVKVGCIPVVVSDAYPDYSPAMPSVLRIEDYCIFVTESDFIKDPLGELAKLADLPERLIAEKLQALAWAQRVVIPDHPESLFVPAFLWESQKAMKMELPHQNPLEYRESLGCHVIGSDFQRKNGRYCANRRRSNVAFRP